LFGRDSLFVELQDHGLLTADAYQSGARPHRPTARAPLLAPMTAITRTAKTPSAHDALLCVQTGALIDDPKRFSFEGRGALLEVAAEMPPFSEVPKRADNTLLIAERANVEIEFGVNPFPIPRARRVHRCHLRVVAPSLSASTSPCECREPLRSSLPAPVRERIDYELGVIASMGFSAYFLVVWDLIVMPAQRVIRCGPGRGSAAGCCVAYCLGIVTSTHQVRPALRTVPEPRAQADARHRMDFDERYAAR